MMKEINRAKVQNESLGERIAKTRMSNPVIRKMTKLMQKNEDLSAVAATYKGIALKTLFFLIMTVVGVGVYFGMHNYFMAMGPEDAIFSMQENIFDIRIHAIEALILVAAAILICLAPVIAWLIRPTIPVTGTIYAFGQGFFIGCVSEFLQDGYKWIGILAMILTIAIVAVMLFLYAKKIVRVHGKFKKIVTILFFSSIFSGAIVTLLSVIPGVKELIAGFNEIMQNSVMSIVVSLGYIVIAALFLLSDFDSIEHCVENKMPKKYEWMAAFGLVYTVIYIYFKILNLLVHIFGNTNNNSNKK